MAVLVVMIVVARQLPGVLGIVPISIVIAGIAAFALGGAVVGTVLPQLAAGVTTTASGPLAAVGAVAGAIVSALVLSTFLHGLPTGRWLNGAASSGRWLIVAGMGAWLGFLLLTSLVLLVDRLDFLLRDWLGILR